MSRRVVLIDDEPLARKRLRRLLTSHPDIEIVGEAGDGPSACKLIDREKPDLVFLDVQMPVMSGFDVLQKLTHRPGVIFVTAHDAFAVQAFEEQAIDYLLKPVEEPRLARALARPAAPGPGGAALTDSRIENLLLALGRAQSQPTRIAVRRGAKVVLVEPSAIVFCRAEDKYTVLYTAEGEHVVDRTIEELAATLDPSTFLRVHRSAIVNLAFVKDLTAIDGGRFVVSMTMPPGTQIYASRAGARMLREKFKI